nr:uncharacterized protein LOC113840004 [Anas platyrhynchos]
MVTTPAPCSWLCFEIPEVPGSVPAGGCCQPAARAAVHGLVPALPGTCSWTTGRWLFLKGTQPLVTPLPWNRRKGELEGTLKADVKNRLFVPSADALSVFEDFHYVLPWPPCAQTRGSRYRQPVLRDRLSSDSGVRQSSRAGMRFFMVLVPVWVSRGGPERLGEVVPSCSTSGECSLQSCSLWGWAVPQDVPHPSMPRLRSCWHRDLSRAEVSPRG